MLAPFSTLGGPRAAWMVLLSGTTRGITSSMAMPATIPARTGTGARDLEWSVISRRASTDMPSDESIMTATDPKTSSRMKEELMYTPNMPAIRAKANISGLMRWKSPARRSSSSHAPIPANIISTEWNRNDCCMVADWCSDTDSVRGLVAAKNGFTALR